MSTLAVAGAPTEHAKVKNEATTPRTDARRRRRAAWAVAVCLYVVGFVLFLAWNWIAGLVCIGLGVIVIVVMALRDPEPTSWENPELFLPTSDPLPLGAEVIARYRLRPRRSGQEANPSAQLRCEEVFRRRVGDTERHEILAISLDLDDYSTDDLLELDLHLRIPVFEAPPTIDAGDASVEWAVEVAIETDDGVESTSVPLQVAPVVVA